MRRYDGCLVIVSLFLLMPISSPSSAFDISVGPVRVCDTCGGGVVGGTRIDPTLGAVPVIGVTVQQFGGDTLTTIQKAANDTARTLKKANGDVLETVKKAGEDTVRTTYKAANDATATYVKAWRDVGNQGKESFDDAVDAGKAVGNFVKNQANDQLTQAAAAAKRLRDGKVVDAMWGLGTEKLQSSEKNFSKATQESKVINAAAATAAATYGGPAGAAAYAAWSTYRQTGNADMALRAGLLAALTSQTGAISDMPTGTTGEILRKSAVAGAAGGLAVAAAGGDEKAIKDGFLKSAGAVIVQAGTDKVTAYSPEAKDAFDTVQCLSARDVDCVSKTTWARDAQGKILEEMPRIDISKLDPKDYTGTWSQIDPSSAEGQVNAAVVQASKLPNAEAIPLLNNQWVLTWTLGKEQQLESSKPTVVLTYVGDDPPFISEVSYDKSDTAVSLQSAVEDTRPDTGNKLVAYYAKPADRNRVIDALEKNSIQYTKIEYIGPEHAKALSNALICGPNTRVGDLKKVANSLINVGIDIKYIGTKSTNRPGQIAILNLQKNKLTVNNKNITRKQINDLSECPKSLKNE
ncbi:hypothetical protein LB543_24945 [Mesorhizobium sp. ESP7-2]|uniref:hypothetical protein n=1 Tax=Mesorhizobium sp. ESP7-2 TaxID=2876622 RepID=UPI001CCA1DC0|nr:hypothetical protein [Mesorhizobium sp. ESP7-2]MBZ9709957.1 hypothetical protein [Mesorhizobium sp. ESP7-2]